MSQLMRKQLEFENNKIWKLNKRKIEQNGKCENPFPGMEKKKKVLRLLNANYVL